MTFSEYLRWDGVVVAAAGAAMIALGGPAQAEIALDEQATGERCSVTHRPLRGLVRLARG